MHLECFYVVLSNQKTLIRHAIIVQMSSVNEKGMRNKVRALYLSKSRFEDSIRIETGNEMKTFSRSHSFLDTVVMLLAQIQFLWGRKRRNTCQCFSNIGDTCMSANDCFLIIPWSYCVWSNQNRIEVPYYGCEKVITEKLQQS